MDDGVTLTILPGTEIKISAAPLTSYGDANENFCLYSEEPSAKMFWVDGKIIAEGTAQDSIIFDRIQDDINYNWGSIYMTEDADLSIFKHCKVVNAAGILVAVSVHTNGLCFNNGRGIVTNCTFVNNAISIYSKSTFVSELAITDNTFIINDDVNPFYPTYNYGRVFINLHLYGSDDPAQHALVANNSFYGVPGYRCTTADFLYFCNNTVVSCHSSYGIGYFFGNTFTNFGTAIKDVPDDSYLYAKNNRFFGDSANDHAIDTEHCYVEVTDNYIENCDVWIHSTPNIDDGGGKMCNNIVNNGTMTNQIEMDVFNNICYNHGNGYGLYVTQNPHCANNISINNEYGIVRSSVLYENCIIIGNEEINQYYIYGNPIFRNCILDFELPEECIDGGGNIWVDSLQAQQIFVDLENGDFRLAPGSIAIDTGFDTLGYYYPFDMDYSRRVWDGDGDGIAIIDIGPYEYGAPELGNISGYITETDSGEPVDHVLIKVNNEPGNFTFADSSGYFEIKLPAGNYDLYAERLFYEDNIIYTVSVEDEQTTDIAFNMTSTLPPVSTEEENILPVKNNYNLTNYPNPFNGETIISFSLTTNLHEKARIEIFNIKGQLVKQLVVNPESVRDELGNQQIIWNANKFASGVYFYKLVVDGKAVDTKKMILLK